MVAKDEMMDVLLNACPSFAPQWQAFLDDRRQEGADPPVYFALAGYARHLIGMLERGETAKLPAVFAAVERLHVEGEPYVREAVTVGLLESLQNTNLHAATEPEQFRQFLGRQTERWWDKLYRFWRHGELLADD